MNQYLTKNTKEDCCGCTACAMVCPTKAIVMVSDEEGYLYPSLNCELCVGCAQCEQVCPMMNRQEGSCIEVIAAKAKDDTIRLASTSGGIFPILANSILAQGGMVAGVVFDDQFSVIHILSDKSADIRRMCGSKYVQSRLDNLYIEILKQIDARKVLFTGTPCQCEGLRRYIKAQKGDIDNLIICDLICDGVPSQKLWKDYVDYLENTFNNKLSSFSYRDKKRGWSYNTQSAIFGGLDKSKLINSKYSWVQLFTNLSFRRPSCYNCPYTNVSRNSDLTIGDFWGIEESLPEFKDELGVSLVIIHSEKGKELWNNSKTEIKSFNSTIEQCKQKRLLFPIKRPENREEFWILYMNNGVGAIIDKYGRRNILMQFIYKKVLPLTKKLKIYETLFSLYHTLTNK